MQIKWIRGNAVKEYNLSRKCGIHRNEGLDYAPKS